MGAGIASQTDDTTKLEGVGPLGPRQIILQVVQPYLEIVAIDNSLIKPQECVPRPTPIADHAKALARVSPEKRISDICVYHGGVTQLKPFALRYVSLFPRVAWQDLI